MLGLAPSPACHRRSPGCPPPAPERVAQCAVRAYAAVQAAPEALARLRQNPGRVPGDGIPANFLRHADEQTVVGLAAVLQAIETFGMAGQSFEDWGVLAAPHFIGRQIAAATMARFVREGGRTTSPHVIPHRSLHSVSGAISVALRIHGPNFGIGGGPGALAEGLATACTMLADGSLPGAWLVLTQWDPEPILDEQGLDPAPGTCHAVALAAVPADTADGGLRLRCIWDDAEAPAQPSAAGSNGGPVPHVAQLAEFVLQSAAGRTADLRRPVPTAASGWQPSAAPAAARWSCTWAGGSRLELFSPGA